MVQCGIQSSPQQASITPSDSSTLIHTSPSGLATFLDRPAVSCFSTNHIPHLFKPHSAVTYSRRLSLIPLQQASAQTTGIRYTLIYMHTNLQTTTIDTNTKKFHDMSSAFYPALVRIRAPHQQASLRISCVQSMTLHPQGIGLEPDCLGSNSDSSSSQLCDLRQMT